MNALALSWQTYRHNLAQRDHRLVVSVLVLLSCFLLLLSMVSASVQHHLEDNLQSMLGSDMVISRFQGLTEDQEQALRDHSTTLATTRLVDINLVNGSDWQRVQLKVVDDQYPVQGSLTVAREPGGATLPADTGPRGGEIWVGSRLFARLGLRVGQLVKVAGTTLEVTAILHHEPDRLLEGHSVKMRALVHEGVIDPGNLTNDAGRYRYLIAADAAQRTKISDWMRREIPDGTAIDRHAGGHPLAGQWRRIENFFGLSSVLLFLIAAIAINMATRRQLAAQQKRFALYLSMGMSPLRGMGMALVEWLLAFLFATLPGVLLAYGLQLVVIGELQPAFPGLQWGWHLGDVAHSLSLVLLLFLCLQAPLFIALYRTSVMSLIRRQTSESRVLSRFAWALATLSVLTASYSDNWLLTAFVLAAMLTAVVLMLCLTWMVLWTGERVARDRIGLWSFVFFIMKNRASSKTAQVLSLGLCATLLLFTLMLMRDVGDSMVSHTRSQNGNLVVSEALQPQISGIERWAQDTGSSIRDMRLFQRAQLTRVNGRSPADHAGHPSETLTAVQDQIRLSWSEQVPDNNRIVDGSWWSGAAPDWQQLSVEEEVMVDLELQIGDVLTFRAGDRELSLNIVASHAVKPGRSAVTFWFTAPPTVAGELPEPLRAMGSMELPDQAWSRLGGLLTRYPTLAVLSLRELTERFDATLAIMTRLTVAYSAMVLLLSVAVLLASMICYDADDRQRNGLLKSMGLSDRGCLRLALYEWLLTGLLAAAGAIAGTWLAGQLIYRSQFQMSYQPDALWMLGALSVCCVLLCALGLAFSRAGLRTSPRQLLANA